MVWLCVSLVAAYDRGMDITPLQPRSGTYVEDLGVANLFSNEWKILIYYDLSIYRMEYRTIRMLTDKIRILCSRISNDTHYSFVCNGTQGLLGQLEDQLNYQDSLLLPPSRKTRSLIGIVGTIAKPLFGLLNEEDAQRYEQEIDAIHANENRLLGLIRNQTTILDMTAQIYNKTRLDVEEEFTSLHSRINGLQFQISSLEQSGLNSRLAVEIESLTSLITLIILKYQRTQRDIVNLLTETLNGKVHASLISAPPMDQLVVNFSRRLPNNLKLPFSVNDNISTQISKLGTMSATYRNERIIIRISLPLPFKETYQVFRLYPLPLIWKQTLCHAVVSPDLVLADINREYYYPMPEIQYHSCLSTEPQRYYCRIMAPLYRIDTGPLICEIKLIRELEPLSGCRKKCAPDTLYWATLSQPNAWIFSTKSQLRADLICNETRQTTLLKGAGILKLQPGCHLRTDAVILHGYGEEISRRPGYLVPNVDLTKLLEFNETYSDRKYIAKINNLTVGNMPDLKPLEEAILAQKREENKGISTPTQHHTHHYVVLYTLILVLVAIYTYYAYRRGSCKLNIRRNDQLVAVAGPCPPPRRRPNFSITPPPTRSQPPPQAEQPQQGANTLV